MVLATLMRRSAYLGYIDLTATVRNNTQMPCGRGYVEPFQGYTYTLHMHPAHVSLTVS